MKEYEIRSIRLKVFFLFYVILMVSLIFIEIDENNIAILIISCIGLLYSLFYIIPQIILNKPLISINQKGICVKSSRIDCEYKDILSMDLIGQNRKQVLVIAYSCNEKTIKRVLNNHYDIKLEVIKEIIKNNMNFIEEQNGFTFASNNDEMKKNINYREQNMVNWFLPTYPIILWIISVMGFNGYFPSYTNYVAIGFVLLGFVVSYIIQRTKWVFSKAIYIHFVLMLCSSIYFIYFIVLGV